MTITTKKPLQKTLLTSAALLVGVLGLSSCGPEPTPTSVVDTWELASVEGTEGQIIPASKVMQLGFKPDGSMSFVACLDPVYEGTRLLTCHEQQACATGTYTFADSVLTTHQTGR